MGGPAAPAEPSPGAVEFYANLLWVDSRKCLIFAEAKTLFCFLVPDILKKDIAPFGEFIVARLEFELVTEELPRDLFGSFDASRVSVGPTRDRAVLGSLVEFGRHAGYRIDAEGGLHRANIGEINARLRRMPMARHGRDHRYPIDGARALLS